MIKYYFIITEHIGSDLGMTNLNNIDSGLGTANFNRILRGLNPFLTRLQTLTRLETLTRC